jgi:hypothetical protein
MQEWKYPKSSAIKIIQARVGLHAGIKISNHQKDD